MRKIKYIPVLLLIAFALFWGGSLTKCENLTWQYGAQFPFPDDISYMSGELDFLKVLELTDTNARIYYVSSNRSVGDTATFVRRGDSWEYEKWEWTIWSKFGSADEFVWPYWYHSATGIALLIVFGIPAILIAIISLLIGNKKRKAKPYC